MKTLQASRHLARQFALLPLNRLVLSLGQQNCARRLLCYFADWVISDRQRVSLDAFPVFAQLNDLIKQGDYYAPSTTVVQSATP
jgi:hypothetical protein